MLTGEALDGLQKDSEAIAEFQEAAKVSPDEPDVHFGLGYLYWKSHQYDEAGSEFEKVLVLDPKHAQALTYLGDMAMKRMDLDKALDHAAEGSQRKKRHTPCLYGYGCGVHAAEAVRGRSSRASACS